VWELCFGVKFWGVWLGPAKTTAQPLRGMCDEGSGFRVSGVGFQLSGLGFRVTGSGCRLRAPLG